MNDSDASLGGADFKVIVCSTNIRKPADRTWTAIGSYADAGRFLHVPSRLVAGDGDIGSVRQIGDSILEVMVGRSLHSYSYAQTRGPMASVAYHGCVSVISRAPTMSTLVYTLVYDQAIMNEEKRVSEAVRIQARFDGAVAEMKRFAEESA